MAKIKDNIIWLDDFELSLARYEDDLAERRFKDQDEIEEFERMIEAFKTKIIDLKKELEMAEFLKCGMEKRLLEKHKEMEFEANFIEPEYD